MNENIPEMEVGAMSYATMPILSPHKNGESNELNIFCQGLPMAAGCKTL